MGDVTDEQQWWWKNGIWDQWSHFIVDATDHSKSQPWALESPEGRQNHGTGECMTCVDGDSSSLACIEFSFCFLFCFGDFVSFTHTHTHTLSLSLSLSFSLTQFFCSALINSSYTCAYRCTHEPAKTTAALSATDSVHSANASISVET